MDVAVTIISVALIAIVAFIFIRFFTRTTPLPPPVPQKQCKPTGCSGQVCSDENVLTACRNTCEDNCYRHAICKRGSSGCEWDLTPEFHQCLRNCAYRPPVVVYEYPRPRPRFPPSSPLPSAVYF